MAEGDCLVGFARALLRGAGLTAVGFVLGIWITVAAICYTVARRATRGGARLGHP
jgi:hypothetical protein